jgi:hypothetical protein
MLDGKILELGVGLVAAILVIREVLGFVGKLTAPKGNGNGNGSAVMGGHVADIRGSVADIQAKVDDLYKWHDQRDSSGVPLWYLQPSLQKSITELTKQTERNGDTLRKILDHLIETRGKP